LKLIPNPKYGKTIKPGDTVTAVFSGRKIKVLRVDPSGSVWEAIEETHPNYTPGAERYIGNQYNEFQPMFVESDAYADAMEEIEDREYMADIWLTDSEKVF
jgi:hypothetical protein